MDGARLFFALWPDATARAALAMRAAEAAAVSQGARPVRAENLHLTLAFLGAVPAQRLGDVLAAAARVQSPAFGFTLDHLEHWSGADVLCAIPQAAPPPLALLAAQLRDALRALQLPVDARPYRPHVTLCRKARAAPAGRPLAMTPATPWRARGFVLAESPHDAGRSAYRIRASWPLAGPMA